jgi:pimeloyl-ACP methyl ester carboxylesterase
MNVQLHANGRRFNCDVSGPATAGRDARDAPGIPGSEFIEVPAAGHLPNVERADVFNAALTHTLNS